MIVKFFSNKSNLVSTQIGLFTIATLYWTDLESKMGQNKLFVCTDDENIGKKDCVNGGCSFSSLFDLFKSKPTEESAKFNKKKNYGRLNQLVKSYTEKRNDLIRALDKFNFNIVNESFFMANEFKYKNTKISAQLASKMYEISCLLSLEFYDKIKSRSNKKLSSDSASNDNDFEMRLFKLATAQIPELNFNHVRRHSSGAGIFKKYVIENLSTLSLTLIKRDSLLNYHRKRINPSSNSKFFKKKTCVVLCMIFELNMIFAKCLLAEMVFPYFEFYMKQNYPLNTQDFKFIKDVLYSIKIEFQSSEVFEKHVSSNLYISLVEAVIDEFQRMYYKKKKRATIKSSKNDLHTFN